MSEYESQARILLNEAAEAVERDAIRTSERGVPVEPWTPEQLLSLALVNAVLAVAESAGRRPIRSAVRSRACMEKSATPATDLRIKRPIEREERVMAKGKEVATYAPGPMNVRCKAHRKNGEQCKRWSIRGATVCATHGGMAPQVRKKAAERIEASLDRAALAVVRLMEDPATPPAVKLAAARDLLDRGDLGPKHVVEVDVSAPWLVVLQGAVVPAMATEEDDHPEWSMEDGRPRASLTPPSDPEPDVVQGEVVPTVNTDDTPPARLDPDNATRRRTGRARLSR